jgi:hypothetical protein
LSRKSETSPVRPKLATSPAERAAEAEAGVRAHARDRTGTVADVALGERGEQRRLCREQRSVPRSSPCRRDERHRLAGRKGEPCVAGRECDPRSGGDDTRSEAVDQRPGTRRADDGEPCQRSDDEPGRAQREAAPVVEVDHLERQHGSPAERVQEDPDLDQPEFS